MLANLAHLHTQQPLRRGEFAVLITIGGGFASTCLIVQLSDIP